MHRDQRLKPTPRPRDRNAAGWFGVAAALALLVLPPATAIGSSPPAPAAAEASPDSNAFSAVSQALNASRWAEADSLATALRSTIESRSPLDSLALARVTDQTVAARIGAGRTGDDVLTMAEDALAIRERHLATPHKDVATSRIRLAQLLYQRGDCAAATPLARSGVAMREQALGPEDIMVARGLVILSLARRSCGDYADARAAAESCIAILEKVKGPDHPEVASQLSNLGVVLRYLGDLVEGERVLRRALAIQEKAFGTESPAVASTLQNLSNIQSRRGKYAEALDLAERVLAIRLEVFGENNAETAGAWNNIAVLQTWRGDYAAAGATLEKALRVYEIARGPDHPDVAFAAENVAAMRLLTGDYEGAVKLLDRSLAIRRKYQGDDHPAVAYTMTNLASAFAELDRKDEARAMAAEGRRRAETGWGPENPETIQILESCGATLDRIGDLDGSREAWELALRLRRKADDGNVAMVAIDAERVADLLRRQNRPAEAGRLFAEADSLRIRSATTWAPTATEALANRALLFFQEGDRGAAFEAGLRAEQRAREQFRSTAQTMPEREALLFSSARVTSRDLLLTVLEGRPAGAEIRAAWESVMASRALVLDEMAIRLRLSRHESDPEVRRKRDLLIDATAELAAILAGAPDPKGAAGVTQKLEAARERRETAERSLAAATAGYRMLEETAAPPFENIIRALPPRSVLVGYVRYAEAPGPVSGARTPTRYGAFVSRAGGDDPAFVPLGPLETIENRARAWRLELRQGPFVAGRSPEDADAACTAAGLALRAAIWDPLLPHLKDADRVFVVPEGELHLVNFGALPDSPGGYLVEQERVIHMLTAERDLLPPPPGDPSGDGLLVLGGAAFDSVATVTSSGAKIAELASSPDDASASAETRGSPNDCPRFQDQRFGPLKGSVPEIEQVIRAWHASPGNSSGRVVRLEGSAASEASLRALAPGRRILHLATHGFYLGGDCFETGGDRGIGGLISTSEARKAAPAAIAGAPAPDSDGTAERATPESLAGVNPFRLAGLALAGANLRDSARGGDDDGILTAAELAVLDLSGTEWAVLSACNSGVGDVGADEGVSGLRRALRLAGARTVILTLWEVRDQDAAAWMESLYDARFRRGLDTSRSVQSACRAEIAKRRSAGLTVHPFYWAGFMAAGDWK